MRSDLTDISCFFHAETGLAVFVSDDGDEDKAVWLPKSEIEIHGSADPRIVDITLPIWLARKKGLI